VDLHSENNFRKLKGSNWLIKAFIPTFIQWGVNLNPVALTPLTAKDVSSSVTLST
jgi:hypothetical protein